MCVLLLVGGCGTASEAPLGVKGTAPDSGIHGTVSLGPTCPVQRADRPCPDQPASGVAVRVEDLNGDVVAATTTDAGGRFDVRLDPGSYSLTADAGMSCCSVPVEVAAGATVEADVECDTGIR